MCSNISWKLKIYPNSVLLPTSILFTVFNKFNLMILTNLNFNFIVITSLMKTYLYEFNKIYAILTYNNHKNNVFVTLNLCFEKNLSHSFILQKCWINKKMYTSSI